LEKTVEPRHPLEIADGNVDLVYVAGAPADCIPPFMARQGLRPLRVNHIRALKVYDLSSHHRDPFDRLLIAQAIVEDMTILTANRAFAKYPVEVL
jgi:PIN domain nuclease of toxin-antitoxin system